MKRKMTKRQEVIEFGKRMGFQAKPGKGFVYLTNMKDWGETFDDWDAAHAYLLKAYDDKYVHRTPYPWSYKENPMKRKPTPAQIAARERFAEMARSGAFAKKAKRNPRPRVTVGDKIAQLMDEGLPQDQAVAIALSEERAGKVKANPRAARRPSLYVGPDPGNRFAQCYSALDDIDFESPYFRERRVTLAKARKANAMLDKVLDMMEKIAKIING